MNQCLLARENTKNRIVAIGLLSVWNGFVTGDLRLQSMIDYGVSLGKHVWHNDDQARKEAIETITCELLD
ncbi:MULTISPECIES: hypothetical protein [Nitrosopumilus]|nr:MULTISPECIES: hypothetical protein [Nitrosopumilus]